MQVEPGTGVPLNCRGEKGLRVSTATGNKQMDMARTPLSHRNTRAARLKVSCKFVVKDISSRLNEKVNLCKDF